MTEQSRWLCPFGASFKAIDQTRHSHAVDGLFSDLPKKSVKQICCSFFGSLLSV